MNDDVDGGQKVENIGHLAAFKRMRWNNIAIVIRYKKFLGFQFLFNILKNAFVHK